MPEWNQHQSGSPDRLTQIPLHEAQARRVERRLTVVTVYDDR